VSDLPTETGQNGCISRDWFELSLSRLLLVALISCFYCVPKAQAQFQTTTTDTGRNLNVDHYSVATGAMGGMTVPTSQAQRLKEWSLGLHAHYTRNPLVVYADRLRLGSAIADRAGAELVASMGLLNWLEIGLALPMTGYQRGEPGLAIGELTTAGIQDPRVHAKIQLLSRERDSGLGIAIVPEVTIPLGDDQAFMGQGGFTAHPQLVIDVAAPWLLGFRFGAVAGAVFRPDVEIGNLTLSNEISYRVGAGLGLLKLADQKVEAVAEVYGRSQINDFAGRVETSPVVGTAGLKNYIDVDFGHQLVTYVGVGAGFNRGYGAPNYQGMIGVMYRRWLSDRDGDGLFDDEDQCPENPEDKDGFEDADGCPDPDNDKDGVPDVSDKCPTFPEDKDGFRDLDGCPDPDNDRDKVLDVNDQCPNVPEDLDGIQDADGCPEEDSDTDGIPDIQDRCPEEKETINGIDDDDGCPDEGKSNIEVTSKSIRINQKIFFELNSARIEEESYLILNQVALTMKANPQIEKIRVEGHADERGSDDYNLLLTQKRAESVMEYIISRGVDPKRIEAVGYGELRPLIEESNEGAWELNRRVEFTIVESGDPASTGGRKLEIPPPEN